MPQSKQQPLTARRGTHEHDFSQSYSDWEAAVFDRANYFAVVEMRCRPRRYTRWKVFPWAVRYAKERSDACIYAVAKSGRFNNLEREKWHEWEQRWRQIVHTIYHIPGRKVGCTNNLERRMYEYKQIEGSVPQHEILEILNGKTNQEAGDIEWNWADKFGYKRGRHYAETLVVSSSPGSFRSMTFDEHSKVGKKGGIRAMELLSSGQKSDFARKGGLVGGHEQQN